MNERIRELVEQAVVAIDIVTGNESLDDELSKMYIPDCFAEKFAELIVRECVIRAEREWIRNGSDTEHNQAVSKVIESIKQHFGVEE